MFCPSCGYEAEGAKYCPECGSDLTLLATPNVCSACGTEVAGAKFCPECGQAVGAGRSSQRGAGRPATRRAASGQAPRAARRAAERAAARKPNSSQPDGPTGRRKLHLITAVAVAAIAVVVLVVTMERGEDSAVVTEAVAAGGKVGVPLKDLAGGEARFYTYDVAGVPVRYFVMQSPDGEYRAAFDASKGCSPFDLGFRQEGTDMVCNKCGEKFAAVGINVLTGECNPAPIDRKVSGEALVLKVADLERGVRYFE